MSRVLVPRFLHIFIAPTYNCDRRARLVQQSKQYLFGLGVSVTHYKLFLSHFLTACVYKCKYEDALHTSDLLEIDEFVSN